MERKKTRPNSRARFRASFVVFSIHIVRSFIFANIVRLWCIWFSIDPYNCSVKVDLKFMFALHGSLAFDTRIRFFLLAFSLCINWLRRSRALTESNLTVSVQQRLIFGGCASLPCMGAHVHLHESTLSLSTRQSHSLFCLPFSYKHSKLSLRILVFTRSQTTAME